MFFYPFSFDSLCGNYVEAVKRTVDAYVTVFNLLDPFSLVRLSQRLQRDFLQVVVP